MNGHALTWIVAKVPGIGMVTGSGANSVLNGTFTVWLGLTFIDLSERDDFELIDWSVFAESLKDSKQPYADVANGIPPPPAAARRKLIPCRCIAPGQEESRGSGFQERSPGPPDQFGRHGRG